MPHYYFDTADGDIDLDAEGVELDSDDDAVREVIRYAGALMGHQPSLFDEKSELLVTARSKDRIVAQVRTTLVRVT